MSLSHSKGSLLEMIIGQLMLLVFSPRAPTTTTPSTGRCGDYSKLINLSTLFYEAQRSGKLPPNQRVTWRKDSALSDKGNNNEDLTGGYYDGKELLSWWKVQAIYGRLVFHDVGMQEK